MSGIMMPKRRGIFGSAGPAPTSVPTATAQPLAPVQPGAPKKEGINWLGVLADALSGFNGGPAHFANRQWEQRQIEDRSRAQALRDASQRTLGMEDFIAKEQWKRANPDPDYFDDNAGNRWTVNPTTGERKLVFRDPNQKMIPQKVTGPNGEEYIEYVKIPNMVNEDGTFQGASAPVSALPEGYSIRGAPGVSEAPRPTNTIARSAYDGWVNLYGKAEADAIMKRNGMTVGGY